MYSNVKQGWYRLLNPGKFVKPLDEHMQSYKEGHVNYKSSLELSAIKYCDWNKHVKLWSLEPFAIPYIKPSTGKTHRYYVDIMIEFSSGDKFLVEIKPESQTKPPRKPRRETQKSMRNYTSALMTYYTNQAKWEAAKEFCSSQGFKFIILTEKQLKPRS